MGRAFEYRRAAKEKRWDKMSKIFPKLARTITLAAKEGGDDPESNAKLRTAILNAKAENMPKDNIKKAIERASGKDGANFTEASYEAKGPHGTLFWIDAATDNTTRTVANVRNLFNKAGGELVSNGSLEFLFNRKAVIEFDKSEEIDLEELELSLMDEGLEEFHAETDRVYVYGDFKDFGSLTQCVEKKGIESAKSSLQRIPTSPVELTEEQMLEVEDLIDKLEDDEDVQAVFTNIA